MKAQKVSKTELAARMHASRLVVHRLLDENDVGVPLDAFVRAALALGVSLRFELTVSLTMQHI